MAIYQAATILSACALLSPYFTESIPEMLPALLCGKRGPRGYRVKIQNMVFARES